MSGFLQFDLGVTDAAVASAARRHAIQLPRDRRRRPHDSDDIGGFRRSPRSRSSISPTPASRATIAIPTSKPSARRSESRSAFEHVTWFRFSRTVCAAFQLVKGLRPVILQQLRERAVGEQPAFGLAHRAIVDLVLAVDDALHRLCRSAGTASPKRPCTAIPSWNAVTFSGNLSPASSCRRAVHSASVSMVARCRTAMSSARQLPGQLERREPRAMKNLIGVRIADPAEQMRIGERALQRVALLLKRGRRMRRRRSSTLRALRDRMTRAPLPPARREATHVSASRPRSTAACRARKSNAASPTFRGIAAPRSRHLNLPAIIK